MEKSPGIDMLSAKDEIGPKGYGKKEWVRRSEVDDLSEQHQRRNKEKK